jgi:hypothetical protein
MCTNKFKVVLLIAMFMTSLLHAQSEKEEPPRKPKKKNPNSNNLVTLGIEVTPILPTGIFSKGGASQTNQAEKVQFEVLPTFSYRFGASIRYDLLSIKGMKLNNQFSLYSGIFYNQRQFNVRINDVSDLTQTISLVKDDFKYTTYEIPFMGQLQLRTGEKIWTNVGAGLGLEVSPSQVYVPTNYQQNQGKDGYYFIYTARKFYVLPSFKAQIGVEFRTDKSGYFHIGACYNLPLPRLADSFCEYWRNGDNGAPYAIFPSGSGSDANLPIAVSGMYFGIDLKYFFKPGKPIVKEEEPYYKRNSTKKKK